MVCASPPRVKLTLYRLRAARPLHFLMGYHARACKMATIEALCAAMRSAGVPSVWVSPQRTPTTRATVYQVCSDLPACIPVDQSIFDRVTGYDHIDGLTRYSVNIDAANTVFSGLQIEAGRGLWPIGTLGYTLNVTASRVNRGSARMLALWSPKPLNIVAYTRPREGSRPVPVWSNREYTSAISSLQTMLDKCKNDFAAFTNKTASRFLEISQLITSGTDQASIISRLNFLIRAAARAGRVVYSHRYRPIRIGRY